MSFNLQKIDQAALILEDVRKSALDIAQDFANDHGIIMRVTAPIIPILFLTVSLAKRVASIAEPFFKGLGNLFGSLFTDKCSAKKGLNQIFIQVPLVVISSLSIVRDIIFTPFRIFQMVIDPTWTLSAMKGDEYAPTSDHGLSFPDESDTQNEY